MSRIRLIGIVFVTVLVGVRCRGPSGPQSDDAASAVVDSIMAATNVVIAGANAADVEAAFADLSAAPDFLAANGARLLRRDEFLTAFRNTFAGLRAQDLRLTRAEVFPINTDVAVLMGEGDFTSTDTAGVTSPRRAFAWTLVWVREPAGWKLRWSHQSLGPLPMN